VGVRRGVLPPGAGPRRRGLRYSLVSWVSGPAFR